MYNKKYFKIADNSVPPTALANLQLTLVSCEFCDNNFNVHNTYIIYNDRLLLENTSKIILCSLSLQPWLQIVI